MGLDATTGGLRDAARPDPRQPTPHFIAGDALRGLAALGVFIFHAGAFALIGSGYTKLYNLNPSNRSMFGAVIAVPLSSVGVTVYLFFALSGYLIARPFVHAFIYGRALPSARRFLFRRVVRVVPVLWIVFTILLIVYGTNGARPVQVLEVYTFTADWVRFPFDQVIGQAWTLNVETRFYLAVALGVVLLVLLRRPMAMLFRSPRSRALLLVAIAVIGYVVSSLVYQHQNPALMLDFPSQFPAFAPGIVLAACEPSLSRRLLGASWARWFGAAFTLAAVVALLAEAWLPARIAPLDGLPARMTIDLYVSFIVTGLLAGPLLVQWSGGGCWRVLDNAPLRWLGSRSYSFYLIHLIVLAKLGLLVGQLGGYKITLLVLLPTGFALTAALAEVSYRLIEVPGRRLRRLPAIRGGRGRARRLTHDPVVLSVRDGE